ncbi:NUDIX domain-containing protein [candidate division WWE3 bacterium]|uniref:NUDIX domain-containing protein n=1 Tax=candidate division WWE3 bacterium TaxID=2053526 RepID=A0A955LJU8_UNCKA|nr:NUDIX domain-containing protein [candidate division WWE3 bacterium]
MDEILSVAGPEVFTRVIVWRKAGRRVEVLVARMDSGRYTFLGGRTRVRPQEGLLDAMVRELGEETLASRYELKRFEEQLAWDSWWFAVGWNHRRILAYDVYFITRWGANYGEMPLIRLNPNDEDYRMVNAVEWVPIALLTRPNLVQYRNQAAALNHARKMIRNWVDPMSLYKGGSLSEGQYSDTEIGPRVVAWV